MSIDWICKIHSVFNYIKENCVCKSIDFLNNETIVIKKTNTCKEIELKFKDFRNIEFCKSYYKDSNYVNESFFGSIICFIYFQKTSESGGGEQIKFTTAQDLVNHLVNQGLIKKIAFKQLSLFDF